jgi:hypothetical protein
VYSWNLRHRNGFEWCCGDKEPVKAGTKTVPEVQESSIQGPPYP